MLKTLKTILLSVKLTRRYNNLQGDFSEGLITLQRVNKTIEWASFEKIQNLFFLFLTRQLTLQLIIHLKNRSKVWKKQHKWGKINSSSNFDHSFLSLEVCFKIIFLKDRFYRTKLFINICFNEIGCKVP